MAFQGETEIHVPWFNRLRDPVIYLGFFSPSSPLRDPFRKQTKLEIGLRWVTTRMIRHLRPRFESVSGFAEEHFYTGEELCKSLGCNALSQEILFVERKKKPIQSTPGEQCTPSPLPEVIAHHAFVVPRGALRQKKKRKNHSETFPSKLCQALLIFKHDGSAECVTVDRFSGKSFVVRVAFN
ncbi:hypothetical protein CEXT_392381 [Caerostris extrusa]|uniref:Uncharacterized protein n=1 Tax=Caerostris extrusa TaxID=172846 RepID=A0AAV4Y5G0_CAEEX|nr:hypothetical protein CEXT_392381 [Caerostris extrusa]